MNHRRFVIVGRQRSGTTVTQAALSAHPRVAMPPFETNVKFFIEGLGLFTHGNHGYATMQRALPDLFDTLSRVCGESAADLLGLKTAIHRHDEVIDFANCLREFLPDTAVIVVHREDVVAQLGSSKRARRTGEWHAKHGASDVRVRIAPDEMLEFAEEGRRISAHFRSLESTHPVLFISYEREIADQSFEGMFRFLDIPPVELAAEQLPRKVAPPPENYIENYAELRELVNSLPTPTVEQEVEAGRCRLLERDRLAPPHFSIARARHLVAQDQVELGRAILLEVLERAPNLNSRLIGSLLQVAIEVGLRGGDPRLPDHCIDRLREHASHDVFSEWDAQVARYQPSG